MNSLFAFLFSLFLLLPATPYAAAPTWTGDSHEGFSASFSLSSEKINLNQNVVISLTLTFPSTYEPVEKALVPNLLNYNGFNASPFTLDTFEASTPIPLKNDPSSLSQHFTITLSPQTLGPHSLTFFAIPFKEKAAPHATKTTLSGILPIDVNASPTDITLNTLIKAPLSLSEKLPIALSTKNKRAFIENEALAKEAATLNARTIKDKVIPWQFFAALIVFAIVWLIAKSDLPLATTSAKEDLNKPDLRKLTLKKIEQLKTKQYNITRAPPLASLDQLLRAYIEEAFGIRAPTLTTQEFLQKAATTPSLHAGTRNNLSLFLSQADLFKFARHTPSDTEIANLLQAAKQVIASKEPLEENTETHHPK